MALAPNISMTAVMVNRLIPTSWGFVMSLVRRFALGLVASAGLLLASVVPASAVTGGVPFTVELTGEAEVTAAGVPNQGDLDGSGTATVTINPGTGEVCSTIEVSDVDPIAAAHIHEAPSTTTGPIVVPLSTSSGCTVVSRELALDIVLHPDSYYVNVHNASYPAGALRGQLDR
jgi:Rieske Fe-S protein